MKKLSDSDIENMGGVDFIPNDREIRKRVRAELKIQPIVAEQNPPMSRHVVLDLHHHTEEQAWAKIMDLATSGARRATIITGASGILRQKFPQWVCDSILTPYVISATPINNGSFDVLFHKQKN